jgi:hypothetical protein
MDEKPLRLLLRSAIRRPGFTRSTVAELNADLAESVP